MSMEIDMDGEKRERSNRDLVLQWGNRKRLRCVKKLNNNPPHHSCFKTTSSRSAAAAAAASEAPEPQPAPRRPATHRERDSPMKTQTAAKSATSSPEKEDKYYSTRGSSGALVDDYAKFFATEGGGERGCAREDKNTGNGHGSHVWPKLFLSLSSKEKEEDFMAMKGCKLPQRPKKRPKLVQKSLLLVSPGAWLSDLCQERYEVREKKASKRRPRGLKAMGSMESESD